MGPHLYTILTPFLGSVAEVEGVAMSQPHAGIPDLSLLRIFDTLFDERSVTRAGVRLGLTQSAVSHALNRLRYELKDELFVRGSEGMQPTPRALEIAPRLRQALLQLQRALLPDAFDPAVTSRRFAVACNDYVAAVLLPQLMPRLLAEAPDVRLQVLSPQASLADDLAAGRLDLAIGRVGQVPSRLLAEPLFTESAVCLMRADHPAAYLPLTRARLAELPHVAITCTLRSPQESVLAGDGIAPYAGDGSDLVAAAGLHRQVRLEVSHILAIPPVLAGSDMVAVVPLRFALAVAPRHRLRICELPQPLPPCPVSVLSDRSYGALPEVAWLRGLLAKAAVALSEPRPAPVLRPVAELQHAV